MAAGVAALSICESLLLALSDLKIITEKDAGDVLRDAAAAHRNACGPGQDPVLHRDVAALIERIEIGAKS